MTKKIMVVEDSDLMVAVISNFIKKAGMDISILIAKSGSEAVKTYEQEKPDLVFMDILMPGMDGLAALEEINKKHVGAKVVMCTSLKEKSHEDRAKAAGCVGYIMKPFSSKDIIDAIKSNI